MKSWIVALALLLLPSTLEAQVRFSRPGGRIPNHAGRVAPQRPRPHVNVIGPVRSHFRQRVAVLQTFPFYPFPYYSPFWPSPGYPASYVAPEPQPTNTGQINSLTYQVEQLTEEVRRLREERALEQLQSQQTPAPEARSAEPVPPPIPTALIFRNGRRIEAEGYAIVGQTLWVLNEENSARFALSDLDLAATRKENLERGIRFLQ